MKKIFSWSILEFLLVSFGIFLYSLSIKLFILPNNLYNGGIMGLSQLIRTFILNTTNIKLSFDIATPIYYLINIPLLVLAYKKISRNFFSRTIYCVTLNTILLAILPDIPNPITHELITNILVGGAICGFGSGLAITIGGSTGGTDIIGMVLTKKYRKVSVGMINTSFNVLTYSICGIIGGIETMVYSILYSIFDSIIVDKMHLHNICSSAFIFTKEKPDKIIKYIKDKLNRDATYWEATGGYNNTKTYITYTVLSKYEKIQFEQDLKAKDDRIFMVTDDGVMVNGNFKKKI